MGKPDRRVARRRPRPAEASVEKRACSGNPRALILTVQGDINERRDGVGGMAARQVANRGNHPRPAAGVAGLSGQKGSAALLAAVLSVTHAG